MKGDSNVFNCSIFHQDKHYFSADWGYNRSLLADRKILFRCLASSGSCFCPYTHHTCWICNDDYNGCGTLVLPTAGKR